MGRPYRGICGIVDDGQRPARPPGGGAAPAPSPPAPAGGDGLSHLAFLYRDTGEYLGHVLAFIADGLACSEPVFAALPGHLGSQVRAAAGAAGWRLAVADMNELGRNPARITHTAGGGTAHIWTSGREVICQGARRRVDHRPDGRAEAAATGFGRAGAVGGERHLRPGRDQERPGRHHHPAAFPPAGAGSGA